ncbi:MAG TPA: YceI family protein [Alphaproteobacteria bacterium]|nr:YceI family protein [Alphaproteobacteria bacterium]
MRLKSFLFAAVIAFSAPVFAEEIPVMGTIKNPAQMPAGVYQLDSSHAHTVFFINHLGFSEYTGAFHDIQGDLNFTPAKLEDSKLNVVIKPASVIVQSAKLTEELKGEKFFNTAKYPEIKFVSTKLVKATDTTGQMTGNLTFMGVTKPVTLNVSFVGGGTNPMSKAQTMGFTASGSIKRSEFGMTNYLPGLSDDVRLDISAEFAQTPPTPARTQ